jgi:hypothetical protein
VVGIIAFPERRRSQDVEPETGFPDPVGIQEIQHRADRLGGFPGKVMEQGNFPRSDDSPYLFMGEQVGADEESALITPRRICTDLSHFILLFPISHAYLVLLVIYLRIAGKIKKKDKIRGFYLSRPGFF